MCTCMLRYVHIFSLTDKSLISAVYNMRMYVRTCVCMRATLCVMFERLSFDRQDFYGDLVDW